MATNELILRKVQAGLETTPGNGVAATRVVYAQTQLSYNQPVQEFVDQSGTRFADRRFAQGRATVGLSATDMVTFEDLPWWMQMGIKGGVTATNPATPGSGTGSGTVGYGYYFKPSASVFDLKTATLEVGEPGNVYKTTQAAVNSFTLRFDPDSAEQSGPLTVGVALSRPRPDAAPRQQRIVVIGDGDFLSNTYLGNGANLELGLNIFNWLTWDDTPILIPPRTAPDPNLNLSAGALALIAAVFLIGLPGMLLASGWLIWFRRRRR